MNTIAIAFFAIVAVAAAATIPTESIDVSTETARARFAATETARARFAATEAPAHFAGAYNQRQYTAAPIHHNAGDEAHAEVLRSESAVNPDSYQYSYETSNGISHQSQGQVKKIGNEEGIVIQGEYSYTGPDGQHYRVTYVADENGFQPQTTHA